MEEAFSPRRDDLEDAIALILDARDIIARHATIANRRALNNDVQRRRRALAAQRKQQLHEPDYDDAA